MRRHLYVLAAVMLALLVLVGRGIIDATGNLDAGQAVSPMPSAAMPPAPAGLEKFYGQDLAWSPCDSDFECADLSVPLDYSNPTVDVITLKVVRLRAAKPIGALVLNPGGPGASGIGYVQAATQVTSQQLRNRYDLVGFDPRGVGASSPVVCLTDRELDAYIAADGSPDDKTEINQTLAIMTNFGKSCAAKSSPLYRHIDTVSAARDIDILRDALDQQRLNWLGKSYGTLLGATYADLFPQNVGRMVLDGALDPSLEARELSYGQALGFEDALGRFIADCPTHKDCPLPEDAVAAKQRVLDMLNQLDRKPRKLEDGRLFTQAMGVTGIIGGLYDKVYGWTELRTALGEALAGNYEDLAQSVDFYTSRQADGTFSDNGNNAIVAINCLDHPTRYSVASVAQDAAAWATEAPVFGAYLAWGNISCLNWPYQSTTKEHPISAPGTGPILVVGTTHDPATPYAWAQALANQLSGGALLTLDGDGHTAYYQGSQCIDTAVDAYFLAGVVPSGRVCNDGP